MQITDQELKNLRKLLPPGACARVARKFGCHRNNIYNIFNGTNKNQEIIDELIAEAKAFSEHSERVSVILKQIKDGKS